MAKVRFSRSEIESLAERLENKGTTVLFDDMPTTQRDMRCAAALLRYFTNVGMPVTPIEIDIFNGTI